MLTIMPDLTKSEELYEESDTDDVEEQ